MAAQVALRRDEEEIPKENGLVRNISSPSNLAIEALNQDTVSSSTEKGKLFNLNQIVFNFTK